MRKVINLRISSPITINQIMHMKYKNLLSLAFAIILAQSLYGQSVVVSSTNADVEHWGDDNGFFVDYCGS